VLSPACESRAAPPSVFSAMNAPFIKLLPLPLAAARWTEGFWADQFRRCREVMVPTMGRLMQHDDRVRWVGNFEVAAGIVKGATADRSGTTVIFTNGSRPRRRRWRSTKDEQLDRELDQLIELVAKAQDLGGYIHTDVQIVERGFATAGDNTPAYQANAGATPAAPKRFGNPMDFEMYNHGHLITAGVVHHAATGKTNLLSLARRAADYLDKEFANPTPERARHGICPSHLMALIDLSRATGEAKYRDLAKRLLDMRDMVVKGDDDNQDRVPLRQQTTAHGHAVRATYLYAGAADVYAETGDATLLAPLDKIWDDLVTKKAYITGGCGALFDGASPDGATDQASITRVHQAFGRDFQLPHSTAHNETCAAVGNVLWNWRMLQITGEGRFADVMENALYNSVLTGISLDGTAFFYTNTLRQLDPMPVELRWPRHRQKTLGCFCCPPNVVRTIAQSSRYAYATSGRGVHVVLYGGSTLDAGDGFKLTQTTDYPWDGHVRITIDAAPREERSIYLRIPRWSRDGSVRVNGNKREVTAAGTFTELRRVWSAGDTIDLDLPMPVRILEANPLVEEARNHVAVRRGPIVYCVEGVDLPAGVRVLDVRLPREPNLEPRRMKELGDVVALEGKGLAVSSGDWSNQLYRDFDARATPKEFHLVLVPYFAWDNRGTSGDVGLAAAGITQRYPHESVPRRRRAVRRIVRTRAGRGAEAVVRQARRAGAGLEVPAETRTADPGLGRGDADRLRPARRDGVRRDGRGAHPVQRGHALDRPPARLRPRRRARPA
jgi:DUF1680 family protein